MKLDIHTAVQTALAIAIIFILILSWRGIRSIQRARDLKFFRIRRDRIVAGWRMIFIALVLLILALFIYRFAVPVAYSFFPPTLDSGSSAE